MTNAKSMVQQRVKAQFEIRHILGMMAGSAVLFAIIAPQLRKLEPDKQFSVLLQAILLAVIVFAIMAVLLVRRRKAELDAGSLLDRLQPRQSRWVFWLITSTLVVMYCVSILSHLQTAANTNVPVVLFGNPMLLFLAVNFVVVRGWWRVDPRAIEICEHGIIFGGFRFMPWDGIRRYSWTGNPIRQLNLYGNDRTVTNYGIEADLAQRLEPILRVYVKSSPEA